MNRHPTCFRRASARRARSDLLLVALAFHGISHLGAGQALAARVSWVAPGVGAESDEGTRERPYRDLGRAIREALDGTTIHLLPGDYFLAPSPYADSLCGNCERESTIVPATVGVRVFGRGIRLEGEGAERTVLHTNAGYGVLFERCEDCSIEGVTVTDGARDTSGNATDAAIVVKASSVRIEACRIEGNLGDSATVAATVVGVMGIAGRRGAEITILGNDIVRNSWDGIALYRGARASIVGNTIDGVDLALGKRHGGGRGVGIGVTWDAVAEIRGNLVTRYWKGIGAFVDARVVVEENVVEEIATWGVTLWDAGRGRPSGIFRRNAIYRTGACGASITRGSEDPPPPGAFEENAVVESGRNPKYDPGEPYCRQTALARDGAASAFRVAGNLFFANREPAPGGGAEGNPGAHDLDAAGFREAVGPLLTRLGEWPSTRASRFVRRFGEP